MYSFHFYTHILPYWEKKKIHTEKHAHRGVLPSPWLQPLSRTVGTEFCQGSDTFHCSCVHYNCRALNVQRCGEYRVFIFYFFKRKKQSGWFLVSWKTRHLAHYLRTQREEEERVAVCIRFHSHSVFTPNFAALWPRQFWVISIQKLLQVLVRFSVQVIQVRVAHCFQTRLLWAFVQIATYLSQSATYVLIFIKT